MKRQHIKIFDTTLRDGQQCPGAGMSLEGNLMYARLAHEVKVDILEAGFPSASDLDFEIVSRIAKEYAGYSDSPVVSALCQLREQQVDLTMEALSPLFPCNRARLHVYLPVDPELMAASLGNYAENREGILRDLQFLIEKAVKAGIEVQFSPEGYSRMGTNFDFVTDTIRTAVGAGASIINCPDTIGGACKRQGGGYFIEKIKEHARMIWEEFPGNDVTWSVHCHNDFGLALENTVNAVFDAPVTQIEGCFNGIGERAGNLALEQCIMYLKHFGYDERSGRQFFSTIHTEKIQAISDFVSRHMLRRQPHWPISGDNAARHTSGGHTNAIIRNPLAYQPFDPKETGKDLSFVFGPLSGSNHVKAIIEKHGFICGNHEKQEISQYIKSYYKDRRKGITDEEVLEAYLEYRRPLRISTFTYHKADGDGMLELQGSFFNRKNHVKAQCGCVDSVLDTFHQLMKDHFPDLSVLHHTSETVGEEVSATRRSNILVECEHGQYAGTGEDPHLEISALKAFVDAGNKAWIDSHYRNKGAVS